jgi:hypothetical protein
MPLETCLGLDSAWCYCESCTRKGFLEQEDDNLWEGLKKWFIERFLWNRSELRLHYWPLRRTLRAILY